MSVHDLAGMPVPKALLVNVPQLITSYYANKPDISDPDQRVSFGTSGHRGSSFRNSFNEGHILAISQAICQYRKAAGVTGPLFIGMDTHALSEPAMVSAIEVFAANRVPLMVSDNRRYTPTPVISHAILKYNRQKKKGLADGVVITPSHNPPEDGGFKYNPCHGGPADTDATKKIEDMANAFIGEGLKKVKRISYEKAVRSDYVRNHDYITSYVADLKDVIDMELIAQAKLKIGVDPLGGASLDFWDAIGEYYGISLEVVNREIDPAFSFMTLDGDGKIRMDCSSPHAMASLIRMREQFDLSFANDADADRHGIVTPMEGLMNSNHFLAVAIDYLFKNRLNWKKDAGIGKTIVSTSIIDRIAADIGRPLMEMPVGFKWFVQGLLDGSCGFGGEESAGASFLRKDGSPWTTDKDGLVMDLLACEIMARTKKDPAMIYQELESKLGMSFYARIDTAATAEQKAVLKKISSEMITATRLGGELITRILTRAPANNADIGGVKVVSNSGWFALRPSGTEDIYKIYVESFHNEGHRQDLEEEAVLMANQIFSDAGV